jgi:hypothetical protein
MEGVAANSYEIAACTEAEIVAAVLGYKDSYSSAARPPFKAAA